METQTEVHIGDRPLEQWRALGYGRRETVVCFYAREAAHKVCAEDWNLAHPGESRFVSDTKPRRRKDDDDHA
ncbi:MULTISPECIES: hypothetical protein [unclassified Streptomyces]|uniref:hypothetical protein n=1 Tax=unclassified Streptomyces TaxID=2593676 RepID=UPI0029A9BEA2|nr:MULTISPECIES: hypothetical protein [unclassified Streptomyces]MDX3772073.1 hypothetical protein [Streptomyces sp. AK08-01B]MDX3821598.1 hypothetical protein [Streptomyces sp. AK08-01A]